MAAVLVSVTGRAAFAVEATSIEVTVTPKASHPGIDRRQLVRFSLPLPNEFLPEGRSLTADDGKRKFIVGLRPLTWRPSQVGIPRSARAAMVTFPYEFERGKPVRFKFSPGPKVASSAPKLPVTLKLAPDEVTVAYRGGATIRAKLIAPATKAPGDAHLEAVESNAYYQWLRLHVKDDAWPRIIEVRADALGHIVVIAHLQSMQPGFGRCPNFGWELDPGRDEGFVRLGLKIYPLDASDAEMPVANGDEAGGAFELRGNKQGNIYHPMQPLNRRGRIAGSGKSGKFVYRYLRAEVADQMPMQQGSWRRADFAVFPGGVERLTPALQSPHRYEVESKFRGALYETGEPLDDSALPKRTGARPLAYHRVATPESVAVGDDAGNITGYSDGAKEGGPFGMNRLNHCGAIFAEALRNSDRKLLDTALLWCDNFYDLSIWWGPKETGGTRYNNLAAMGQTPPPSNPPFMWRSNSAVSFCTKGFDSFFIAYEQTGDPRYLEALNAQVDYASKYMTAGANYTRNVGCVRDFCNLFRWTGEQRYLDQALRLFRELRTQLSTGDLFTESGKPIEANPPFIENDAQGYEHPFAKPYILGYALEGLPDLLTLCPKEPKLREVVAAVAKFIVESQDPVGGWRYPHPRSSYVIMSQAMEHAWQIMQADQVLKDGHEARLDAIERVLRQRIQGWLATGKIWSGITGWEMATGKVKKQEEIPALYAHPEDRDFKRDYREGRADFGSAPPEGIVYFPEVLRYYLKHRPASRLLAPPAPGSPLAMLLERSDGSKSKKE